MQASIHSAHRARKFRILFSSSAFVFVLALAAPAALAAGDSGGDGGDAQKQEKKPIGGQNGTRTNEPDLTPCEPGQVWDAKQHKCLQRHGGVIPDSELTEYAFALAKANRFQEAI